jgi:hypothetical protein
MIAKEKITPAPTDKFGRAGHDAEMQMAFYLRRAFAESPDIYVFNDLRLERNGEVAQIDHLVFHRFGFLIIESKSVVGTITVNEKGEFARSFDGYPRGMPSPIRQAQLQAELLGKLLNDHKETLRRKVFLGLQQGYFGDDRFRVLVAISDTGVIVRQHCDPPELCKAEQVAEAVRQAIKRHTYAGSLVGIWKATVGDKKTAAELGKDHMPPYTDEEMASISAFLLERHAPRSAQVVSVPAPIAEQQRPPQVVEVAAPQPARITCRHCKSTDVTGLHGRYGYFVKCNACQGNTSMDQTCTNCKAKARIQKSGPKFSRVCEACGKQVVVHENALTPTE